MFFVQGLSHLETLHSVATEMSSVSPGEMTSVSPGGLRQPLTSLRASPGLSPLKDKQNGEDKEDMEEREEREDKEGRESRGGMTNSHSGNTNMTSVHRSGNGWT